MFYSKQNRVDLLATSPPWASLATPLYLKLVNWSSSIKVQGWQKATKGPRLAKGTQSSKVGKRNLKFQGSQKVPKDPRLAKGILRPQVPKGT